MVKTESFILVGHSMGGMLVLRHALSYAPEEVTKKMLGVVSIAPWLALSFEPPKIKALFGRLLNFISPSFTMDSELKHEELSRVPEEVEFLRNEPMRHHRISAGTFVLATDAGAFCLQNASGFKYPLLLLHGTGDAICSYEGSSAFAEAAQSRDGADVELVTYDGGYHLLHRDLVADEVLDLDH
jgi:acylglycerol lipase